MYREDSKLAGIPVINGDGRDVEGRIRKISDNGFSVPYRIEYKERLKANVDKGETNVNVVAIGPKYMYGLLTEWDVLYFLNGRGNNLNAIALSDLIDVEQL